VVVVGGESNADDIESEEARRQVSHPPLSERDGVGGESKRRGGFHIFL